MTAPSGGRPASGSSRILIVEDDRHAREGVAEILRVAGYRTEIAATGQEASVLSGGSTFDLLLSDIRLPDGDGLSLALELKKSDPDLAVVLMTAYGSVRDAVGAMQKGVDDYLTKPLDFDELRLTVSRLIEGRRLREENRRLRDELGARYGFKHLVGQSPARSGAMEIAAQAAAGDSTVLLTGESGTGKELVAHAIHRGSPNRHGPFVALNCAAIPANLLENELFGHEPGAFTGATKRYIGKVEAAHRGTLLLDEVGDMPLELQAKILRLIENKTLTRLGGNTPVVVDFRVIASTHRNLIDLIRGGRFREDLYYRLNVLHVSLPPLRERKSDIPLLLDYFLSRLCRKREVTRPRVADAALELLSDYGWPGNVRELENVAERALITAGGTDIDEKILAKALGSPDRPAGTGRIVPNPAADDDKSDLESAVRALERLKIQNTLDRVAGNRTRAASMLGVSLRTLQYKIKSLGII
ncbi:sigma-54-dependent Fis family transcriptional regulator [bacterium]|nr:sigma-54-dependent Fis family transcriptional regulator [bacterium]